MRRKKNIIN